VGTRPHTSRARARAQGHVCVWNCADGLLSATLRTHGGDVLALAGTRAARARVVLAARRARVNTALLPTAAPGGEGLVSGGADGKVVSYKHVPDDEASYGGGAWIVTGSHRGHTHDVRGVAVSPTGLVVRAAGACAAPGCTLTRRARTRR
jgi:hypothetical protein